VKLAKSGDRYEKIHAKGAIVDDDRVVLGSLNWNEQAATNNREVILLLYGDEVADYYGDVFDADWGGGKPELPVGLIGAVVGCLIGWSGRATSGVREMMHQPPLVKYWAAGGFVLLAAITDANNLKALGALAPLSRISSLLRRSDRGPLSPRDRASPFQSTRTTSLARGGARDYNHHSSDSRRPARITFPDRSATAGPGAAFMPRPGEGQGLRC